MRPARRTVPGATVIAAAACLEGHTAPVPDELLQRLTSAVAALLEEGWTVDEVAAAHRLSVSDLTALHGPSPPRP